MVFPRLEREIKEPYSKSLIINCLEGFKPSKRCCRMILLHY
jgi:hypothetical protein